MRTLLLAILTAAGQFCHGQLDTSVSRLTPEQANKILDFSLKNRSFNNLIGTKPVLTDTANVVAYAELVLFTQYGEKEIQQQKPYDIFHINNYWIIGGTMPGATVGGTFLVIIDDRNYEILRLTHGE